MNTCDNNTCGCGELSTTEREQSAPRPVFAPPSDVFESPDAFTIVMDVPGATESGVNVAAERGVLTVSASVDAASERNGSQLAGEFETGDYRRAFRLGEDIDVDGISASLKAGVLTLTLPKSPTAKPRRIPVNPG